MVEVKAVVLESGVVEGEIVPVVEVGDIDDEAELLDEPVLTAETELLDEAKLVDGVTLILGFSRVESLCTGVTSLNKYMKYLPKVTSVVHPCVCVRLGLCRELKA